MGLGVGGWAGNLRHWIARTVYLYVNGHVFDGSKWDQRNAPYSVIQFLGAAVQPFIHFGAFLLSLATKSFRVSAIRVVAR